MGVLDRWIKSPSTKSKPVSTPPKERKTIAAAASHAAAQRVKESKPVLSQPKSIEDFDPFVQKKLTTYFNRLKSVYPDMVIIRLNTGQKKLAERGANLRKFVDWQGTLDEFFALGGFTYKRSESGRPQKIKDEEDIVRLVEKIKQEFPNGVQAAADIRQQNPSLYLDIRSAARASQCTLTEFFNKYNLYIQKEST